MQLTVESTCVEGTDVDGVDCRAVDCRGIISSVVSPEHGVEGGLDRFHYGSMNAIRSLGNSVRSK